MKALTAPSYTLFVLYKCIRNHFYWILGLIVCLLSGIVSTSKAQFQKPDISMPSPNAASIGLYGQVPVSLYTGTPNVDVPIYTIQDGKLKVPITMSYHASGVRVNQHPGWVGLNWNLNAGGAITRIARDRFDEANHPYYLNDPANQWQQIGYYFQRQSLNQSNWESAEFINSLWANSIPGSAPDHTTSKLHADTEPDEFRFNFLGYSGKFFLDVDGNWKVDCDQRIKVELVSVPLMPLPNDLKLFFPQAGTIYYPHSFRGFILTTPDGIKYQFGNNSNAVEYEINFFSSALTANSGLADAQWMVNSWYLTKMTSPEGYSIDFEYEVPIRGQGKFIASFYRSLSNSLKFTNPGSDPLDTGCGPLYKDGFDSTSAYSGALIRPTYLKKISWSTGKALLETSVTNELPYKEHILTAMLYRARGAQQINGYFAFPDYLADTTTANRYQEWSSFYNGFDTEIQRSVIANKVINLLKWRQLQSIEIKNNSEELVDKWSFSYTNSASTRLYLNSINHIQKDNNLCVQKFDLQYYNDLNNSLPDYLDINDQTDHWGFFNKNIYSIKNFSTSNYDSYRLHKNASTVLEVVQEGSLKQISFPTTGYTKFEYQPNSAYKYQNFLGNGGVELVTNVAPVGGIRIGQIINYDGDKLSTKSYEYTYNNASSGIISGFPQYVSNATYQEYNGTTTTMDNTFSSQNTLPMSQNTSGTHIGYREVKEILADGSFTIYKFTNYESSDNIQHLDDPVPMSSRTQANGSLHDARSSNENERGKLLFEEQFTSTSVPVYKKEMKYERYNSDFVRAVKVSATSICETFRVFVDGYAYRNNIYQYLPNKQIEVLNDQNDQAKIVTTVNSFSYNAIGLPSSITTSVGSKTTVVNNKYSVDYISKNQASSNEYNTCTLPCTTIGCSNDCETNRINFISNSMADKALNGIWGLLTASINNALVEQHILNNDNSTNELKLVMGSINLFRDYTTSSQRANGFFNPQVFKILSLTNTEGINDFDFSTVTTNSGPPLFDPSRYNFTFNSKFSKLIVEFPDVENTGEAYTLRGEPVNFTDGNGITTNLTYLSGTKTGLLASKTVQNQITQYDYKPLVGLTLLTDANLFQTKYEYDGFNRLSTVRDHWNNLVQSYAYKVGVSSGCVTPQINAETPVNPALEQPDLLPIIYALPATAYGTTNLTVVVEAININDMPSAGLIEVYISKDALISLNFSSSATIVGGRPVQNASWTLDNSNPDFYIFSTTSQVNGGESLALGMSGTITPGNTRGNVIISSVITGGGETRLDNNSDADKIEYYHH